jgi:hypothetical protein
MLLLLAVMATCAVANAASSTPQLMRCCVATHTSLKASKTSVSKGANVSLTVTVSPSKATGSVTFYNGKDKIGKTSLAGSVATLHTTTLPVGKDVIKAVYDGAKDYDKSTSKTVTVVVGKGSSCNCRSEVSTASAGR